MPDKFSSSPPPSGKGHDSLPIRVKEMEYTPDQTNYGVLATCLRQSAATFNDSADEIDRLSNVPALDNVVAQISLQLTALEQRMERRIDALEQRMDRTDQKIAAMNKNMTARMHNRTARQRDCQLYPLYSMVDGTLIPNFPARLCDVENLTGPQVNALLEALDEPVAGNVGRRRTLLSYAIGLDLYPL